MVEVGWFVSYHEIPFSELKQYFETTDLPKSVGVKHMIVHDVKNNATYNINLIERLIASKVDLKKSAPAMSAKYRLYTLMNLCKDTSTHNITEFPAGYSVKINFFHFLKP
jgi:hypothetical protein